MTHGLPYITASKPSHRKNLSYTIHAECEAVALNVKLSILDITYNCSHNKISSHTHRKSKLYQGSYHNNHKTPAQSVYVLCVSTGAELNLAAWYSTCNPYRVWDHRFGNSHKLSSRSQRTSCRYAACRKNHKTMGHPSSFDIGLFHVIRDLEVLASTGISRSHLGSRNLTSSCHLCSYFHQRLACRGPQCRLVLVGLPHQTLLLGVYHHIRPLWRTRVFILKSVFSFWSNQRNIASILW